MYPQIELGNNHKGVQYTPSSLRLVYKFTVRIDVIDNCYSLPSIVTKKEQNLKTIHHPLFYWQTLSLLDSLQNTFHLNHAVVDFQNMDHPSNKQKHKTDNKSGECWRIMCSSINSIRIILFTNKYYYKQQVNILLSQQLPGKRNVHFCKFICICVHRVCKSRTRQDPEIAMRISILRHPNAVQSKNSAEKTLHRCT